MHNPVEQTTDRTQACGDRLRQLPTELQPPYNWQEFKRRAGPGSHTSRSLSWRHVAAAAGVLLIVCGIAIWGRIGTESRQVAAIPADPPGIDDAWQGTGAQRGVSETTTPDIAVATGRSRAIESWLATLPREPVVVRVGTRADVAHLEDRIAQVDDLLTSLRVDGRPPDRLAALQRERVRLVGALAQVRYAEVLASESQ